MRITITQVCGPSVISRSNGARMREEIELRWSDAEPLEIDFERISIASISFLDEAIAILARFDRVARARRSRRGRRKPVAVARRVDRRLGYHAQRRRMSGTRGGDLGRRRPEGHRRRPREMMRQERVPQRGDRVVVRIEATAERLERAVNRAAVATTAQDAEERGEQHRDSERVADHDAPPIVQRMDRTPALTSMAGGRFLREITGFRAQRGRGRSRGNHETSRCVRGLVARVRARSSALGSAYVSGPACRPVGSPSRASFPQGTGPRSRLHVRSGSGAIFNEEIAGSAPGGVPTAATRSAASSRSSSRSSSGTTRPRRPRGSRRCAATCTAPTSRVSWLRSRTARTPRSCFDADIGRGHR